MTIKMPSLPASKLLLGLPIYNGATHIEATIKSILSQTFSDFTLLVSDNLSTDNTSEIVLKYAESDPRIVYVKQDKNLGMAGNFNYVRQTKGFEYFKWCAHDDIIEPSYLDKCIRALDDDPNLVMAHSLTNKIDSSGKPVGTYKDLGLSDSSASSRFYKALFTVNIYEIYSVIRSSALQGLPPIDTFFGSERNLLVELVLKGNIHYTEQYLFSRRDHDESLTALHHQSKSQNNFEEMQKAHDTSKKISKSASTSKKITTYLRSISREKLPVWDKLGCYYWLLFFTVVRTLDKVSGKEDGYRRRLYHRKNLQA